MKQRKSIIALLLIAIIGIVGLTVAYFSSSTSIENTFETSEYGADAIETFTSPTDWQPGDETPKVLTVKNTGEVDEAVRVKVEESWKSKNNTDLPLTQGNNVVAITNWTNTDDWTKVTVDGEDYYYYYYNYKLAPDEETGELLDKVTFNPLIDASTTCTTTTENGVTTKSCKSNGSGYDGATYKLKFTIETVQYNKYKEAWSTNISIAPTKEIVVFGLHVNPKSETYETGDKHHMFAFKHARTAQTPAQTDYRYIGDDPYNYVYFNCDDLNNQSLSTCEVWRIIGVFDVERNDPENQGQTITEQRMKLVRGSYLATEMVFNSSNKNDWSVSQLKAYLNGDYYNRSGDAATYGLKEPARSLIAEAKYYLGAVSLDSTNSNYGTTERIYGEERGNTVCGACNSDTTKLTWTGSVGLMYPSDEYMVYGNGVNNTCYTNPNGCNVTKAQAGWVYKSNVFEGQSSPTYTWFLSSNAGSPFTVLIANYEGILNNYSSDRSRGVRPIVYLSADVKIIDGDGTSGNPYQLKK
ncbi:MAG: hypothetical protein IJR82_03300 [Bacilli bacterium]|nr:hypothetical protein [Bacilli bacterium]